MMNGRRQGSGRFVSALGDVLYDTRSATRAQGRTSFDNAGDRNRLRQLDDGWLNRVSAGLDLPSSEETEINSPVTRKGKASTPAKSKQSKPSLRSPEQTPSKSSPGKSLSTVEGDNEISTPRRKSPRKKKVYSPTEPRLTRQRLASGEKTPKKSSETTIGVTLRSASKAADNGIRSPTQKTAYSPAAKPRVTKSRFKSGGSASSSAKSSQINSSGREVDSGLVSDQSSPFLFTAADLQDAIVEVQHEFPSNPPEVSPLSAVADSSLHDSFESESLGFLAQKSPNRLKKRTLDSTETDESTEPNGPARKFFKTRYYISNRAKYQVCLNEDLKKTPKRRSSTKSLTPTSQSKKKLTKNAESASDYDFEADDDSEGEQVEVAPAKKKKIGKEKVPKAGSGSPKKRGRKKKTPGVPTKARRQPKPPKGTSGVKKPRKVSTKGKKSTPDGSAAAAAAASEESSDQSTNKPSTSKSKFKSGKTVVHDVYDEVTNAPVRGLMQRLKKSGVADLRRTLKNMNENFVRIDVEKKKFVRGKKKITGAKMKRSDWRLKKKLAAKDARIKLAKCHKCQELGHYAKYCLKDLAEKELIPDNIEDCPFPSLEEAARAAWNQNLFATANLFHEKKIKEEPVSRSDASEVGDTSLEDTDNEAAARTVECTEQSEQFILATTVSMQTVEPLLAVESEGSAEEEELLEAGLRAFNYTSFRPGQREAISRVIRGLSTLLILGTGSGKTLCYQLPAYLYAQRYPGAISLCVSPLVSLMDDQVNNAPKFLKAACLHTQMTRKQKETVLEKVKNRKISVLLVSPEAVCSGLFGLLRNVEEFPPVAFVCIDEVHCVSEWSHNFRPSYLKLCKVLREKLMVKTILGLTATATNCTAASVCEHLNIEPSTKIQGQLLPSNLNLTISRDTDRDTALLELLEGERFINCDPIIIYCTRRAECERIGQLLRTIKYTAQPKSSQAFCDIYHAGLRPSARRHVQKNFMAGRVRIVVATVAFGMGINKADIRAIIHYNMPKTFESYVQEIGRAGRDGKDAECHLFLDSSRGKDLSELKRHIYSNYVDRKTLRNLMKKIFKRCVCAKIDKLRGVQVKAEGTEHKCTGHEVSFSVATTTIELDLADENIETLLCYLESDPTRKWVEMLPKCYHLCKIQSYGGTKLLRSKALTCPPLAAALALQKENKKFKETDTHLEFNMVEVASTLGWNSALVRRELKSLEWTGIKFTDDGKPESYRKSGLIVEFSDLAYRVITPGDVTDEEQDYVLNYLHKRCTDQEKTQLYQLHKIHQAFQSVSSSNILSACDSFNVKSSEKLKNFIVQYFGQTSVTVPTEWKLEYSIPPCMKEETVREDVSNLLYSYRDIEFNGRAVAKIFHGIESPCFPASQWNRNKTYWRKHLDVDFQLLVKLANEVILSTE